MAEGIEVRTAKGGEHPQLRAVHSDSRPRRTERTRQHDMTEDEVEALRDYQDAVEIAARRLATVSDPSERGSRWCESLRTEAGILNVTLGRPRLRVTSGNRGRQEDEDR
jgi:hypothetical protein